MMRVALVVTTYNRPDALAAVLEGCLAQTDANFEVIVADDQLSLAIGKKGQNIRLATELSGFELDMYNYEELPAFKAKLAELKGESLPAEEAEEAPPAAAEAPTEAVQEPEKKSEEEAA